jgi:hypothetical protein
VVTNGNILWCAHCDRPMIAEEMKFHVCRRKEHEDGIVEIRATSPLIVVKPDGTKMLLCEDLAGKAVVVTFVG